MTPRRGSYCPACDHRIESDRHQQQCIEAPGRVLADLIDLCDVIDRRDPAHRYVSTSRIREAIGGTVQP